MSEALIEDLVPPFVKNERALEMRALAFNALLRCMVMVGLGFDTRPPPALAVVLSLLSDEWLDREDTRAIGSTFVTAHTGGILKAVHDVAALAVGRDIAVGGAANSYQAAVRELTSTEAAILMFDLREALDTDKVVYPFELSASALAKKCRLPKR
jgi:hypothetical protein